MQYNNYLLIYLISSFVFVLFSSLKFYGSPQEFNNYGRAQKPNVLNGVGAGLARCLELESVAALCVAVWGYPQFAAGDQVTTVTNAVTAVTTVSNNVTNTNMLVQVTQYYCLVPLVATILLHQRDVRPLCEEAPDR